MPLLSWMAQRSFWGVGSPDSDRRAAAAAIPGTSVDSLWFVRTALAAAGRTGFTYEAPADLARPPGRGLFGPWPRWS